jgi:MFS family permease
MKSTFVTVFSTIVPVGVLIGSMIAGKMMNYYGRRKSMMMTDILMMFSSGITVVPFTPTFAIGRFLSGIAAGVFMTIPVSFVNEVTPDEMLPKIGPLVQISTNVGLIFAYGFGLPLPTGDYDSNSFNWWWVFMFLFPGFVANTQRED